MHSRLASRRLYIADLARRQAAMEAGTLPLHPVGYRVLAKRLREALAGLTEPAVRSLIREWPASAKAVVQEMLDTRHFHQHGRFPGATGDWARGRAAAALSRASRGGLRP